MTFLWSGLLLLLPVLVLPVLLYVWTQRRSRPPALRYSSLELIRAAVPRSPRWRRHVPFAIFIAAIGALLFGLARPVVVLAVPTDQTTIILTMDVSGSMCSTDIPPSRIQAAEAAAASFIKGKASSAQIGIVAFSTYAEIVQAPTTDQEQLMTALGTLLTGQRTAIGEGILSSIDAIAEVDTAVAKSQEDPTQPGPTPVPQGDYAPDIVVLLTDGASNTGIDPLVAAQEAADRGVRVYTIGFGTANGGAMGPTCFRGREPGNGFGGGGGGGFGGGFQKIADMTGAKYYPAESADQLNSVFESLPLNLVVKHQATEVSFAFVSLGALLAGLGLILGRAWRPLP